MNHSLPVAELWSGTVLVAGSGVRGQAEERGFELLCAVCWLRSGCQPGTAAGAGMLWKCRKWAERARTAQVVPRGEY